MNVKQIGQEVEVKEDFKINTIVSDKVITVKEGDKGFLNSKGFLNITTGKGKGKIVKINNIELRGYDNSNIAKMIFKRLKLEYGIQEFLEDNDVEEKDFIDSIWDVLTDIL